MCATMVARGALMLIESGQALYKANRYEWPTELWNVKLQKWEPYKGFVPKDATWGNVITDADAEEWKRPI